MSRRLVFPVAQVYSVQRGNNGDCDENCSDGKRILIGAGIGGLVGGLVLAGNSARAGAFGAMIGAGVGGSFAASPVMLGAPARPAMSVRVPLGTFGVHEGKHTAGPRRGRNRW